ncbi:uncharacterized protein [Henckelia pumila]|uniref:uncharacterized protein n=1 Tax=Henckelia pumila TaxID=405737 RepID=UPI003C6E2841
MDHRVSRGTRPTDLRGISPTDLKGIRPRDPLNCPEFRRPTTGRVFVMQAEEANPDTTLITDILEIFEELAKNLSSWCSHQSLLDSGATHSFISEAFMHKWGIQQEELSVEFSVIIPSGEELTTKTLVISLELQLQGQTVDADLIVLLMPEFDLILGMDWMVKNAVVIDF